MAAFHTPLFKRSVSPPAVLGEINVKGKGKIKYSIDGI